jgi:hypothetical protein
MAISEQPLHEIINFDILLRKCFEQNRVANQELLVCKTVILLSITTGLKMEYIMTLKWGDIVFYGSESEAKVKEKLVTSKKMDITIHKKVGVLLLQIYTKLKCPDLEYSILDYEIVILNNYHASNKIFAKIIYKVFSFLNAESDNYYEYLREINTEFYTQLLFGRKVFEVNGYTTEFCKKLKQYFGIRQNKDLFNFLGYASKEDIKYELRNINLSNIKLSGFDSKSNLTNNSNGYIELEDLNFNTISPFKKEIIYPFQKFSTFSNFLINSNTNKFNQKPIESSIRILLLLSLYNGIRLSTLLKLNWKDIVEIDENKKEIIILDICILGEYTIKIGNEAKEMLLNHIKSKLKRDGNYKEFELFQKQKDGYLTRPKLDTPIFITNTYNPLTQHSLSREIEKVLNYWKFPHTNKFTTKSTLIMYGRRIIEIKGDHQLTIKKLKEHFNFRGKKQLLKFLYIDNEEYKLFKGKKPNIFQAILYDL